MPRPKGIVCNLCNGEFFKNSYPIHRKKCEKKYLLINEKCNFCGRMVHKNDMATHEPPCKKRNGGKTLEQRQKIAERKRKKRLKEQGVNEGEVDDEIAAMERKLAALKAAKRGGGGAKKDVSSLIPPNPNDPNAGPQDNRVGKKIDLEAEIQKAAMEKAPGSEDDGRIPCSCCGRKFNPDRIVTHEDICLRSKEKRAAQKKKIKPKTGEDLRLKDTEFIKYKNKRAPDVVKQSRWRDEAQKLMNIVQAGRNVVRFQRAGVPLSELPPSGEDIATGYDIGDPVMTNDGRRGEVMWVGEIPEFPGDEEGQIRTFIGVEFNNRVGQHDGTCKANGKRLFNGQDGHCSFFLPPKLLRVKSAVGPDLKTNFKRKKNGYQAKRKPGAATHKTKKLSAKFEDMARPKYETQRKPKPPPQRKVTAESRPQVQSAAAKAAAARMERMANGSGANATKMLRASQSAGERKRQAKPKQAGGMVMTGSDGTVKKLRTRVKKSRSARSGSSKENRPEHVQAWGGKNNAQTTERKKPYGNQTLSNASMKYRANKSKGAPSQEAASAAYKARMRLKKNSGKLKSYHQTGFGADSRKIKNNAAKRAKAKPAFGSAAKSVADDLNDYVFGKEKKQKEYLSNGKFRYKTQPREKKQISKKRQSPRTTTTANKLGGGNSPPVKREVRSNPVDMGNKGKSLGGTGRGRGLNQDEVRAKRLAFLERMQNS